VIPYLIFDYSLFPYQRYHLLDFSVYINPYIRGIEGVIIAAITGGVSGLVINNQTIKHIREAGKNNQN
jgi:hypothetical protein